MNAKVSVYSIAYTMNSYFISLPENNY